MNNVKRCHICAEQQPAVQVFIESVPFTVCDRCLSRLVSCWCEGQPYTPDREMVCRFCLPIMAACVGRQYARLYEILGRHGGWDPGE